MKGTIKEEVIITLFLNKEEALWLKSLMQNPIKSSNENPEDTKIRTFFWNTLRNLLGA